MMKHATSLGVLIVGTVLQMVADLNFPDESPDGRGYDLICAFLIGIGILMCVACVVSDLLDGE